MLRSPCDQIAGNHQEADAETGGMIHHQAVRMAPAQNAQYSILPQLMVVGSPRPTKLRLASAVTPQPTPSGG